MAISVVCGAECGVAGNAIHYGLAGTASVVTSNLIHGLRSWRCNPSNNTGYVVVASGGLAHQIGRVSIRFDTLPNADTRISNYGSAGSAGPNIVFDQSESKIYCAVDTTRGATGFTVTTGVVYDIDYHYFVNTSGNDTCDATVNGTALGQATAAGLSGTDEQVNWGILDTCTADIYIDNLVTAWDSADYPIDKGFVNSYIFNADGSHNIAGPGDFENELGTDFSNSSTNVWESMSKRPMPSSITTYLNLLAPANSTDYVQCAFENSAESVAPLALSIIAAFHAAGTSANNLGIRVGTDASVFTTGNSSYIHNATVGSTSIIYAVLELPEKPGTSGGAWDTSAFNNLCVRIYSSDANPDPRVDALMVEAFFPDTGPTTHLGAVTLAGEGVLTPAAHPIFMGSVALTGEGGISPQAQLTAMIAALLAGEGIITASGGLLISGAAVLDGEGNLTAAGLQIATALAALTGEGDIAAIGRLIAMAQALLAGEGTLTASAIAELLAQATLAGEGNLTASGGLLIVAAALLAGEGDITANGVTLTIILAAAALAGEGNLTASAILIQLAQALLAGEGTLTATAIIQAYAAALLAGEGDITAAGEVITAGIVNGAAVLDGEGFISATAQLIAMASALLAGEGNLTPGAIVITMASVVLAGEGALNASALNMLIAQALLAGEGNLTATAQLLAIAQALLAGEGFIVATPEGLELEAIIVKVFEATTRIAKVSETTGETVKVTDPSNIRAVL